jgi:hypothetical protein
MAWRRVRRVESWFLAVMVQWFDVRKQGGRVAVPANYVSKWLTWTMHCNYTILKKVSETCYPPSLFGKSLPELVYMESTPGQKTPVVVVPVDTVAPDHILQGLGLYGWRRVRRLEWQFLTVIVQWLGVSKQGGRVAVPANYVSKWLTWIMHCNDTVLNKVSETCYPPSLWQREWRCLEPIA